MKVIFNELRKGRNVGEHVWKTLGKLLMTCLQTVKTQSKHCLFKAVIPNLLNLKSGCHVLSSFLGNSLKFSDYYWSAARYSTCKATGRASSSLMEQE